jgi:NADPH-dependent glutamate synthase beta subunit-like oxidoreductase/Pyruvate/2-oxoacid:ferredoxin oxidoreductase delta subunit
MQMGFYFDQTRCTGCYACIVACKDWHDIPAGPAFWRRVTTVETGTFPRVFVTSLSSSCYHCATPLCSVVCPANAITKREEDGVVIVDSEKCREAGRCGIISEESTRTVSSFSDIESPCQLTCPAHLNIPAYVALISKGKFKEALDLIRKRMPLPVVCGRICHAPCEKECRRQELDQAVSIKNLKRFVTDYVDDEHPPRISQTLPDNVAIIGSGPAGLAAAYDLIRMGYGVTIYEASPLIGGLLSTGIPSYRLPKEELKRDIDYIKTLGVNIETNSPIGKELTLDELERRGYRAILLAIGAQKGIRLEIPGADLKGVLVATSFMQNLNLGEKINIGKKVVVIGGGNAAIDCARTALRLGADTVDVACLECREDMPAEESEIEQAEEEGVTIHPNRTFTRILYEGGNVTGVECLNLKSVEFDEKGQPHMDVIEGTEHILPADTVIFAIGQKTDPSDLDEIAGDRVIETTAKGTIAINPETMATSCPGIFAAGDASRGSSSVIEAIADGQKAALYIDLYLRGRILRTPAKEKLKAADIKIELPADVKKEERQRMSALPASERKHNFEEVNVGFTPDAAVAEAKRCLNCAGHLCLDVCPYNAPQFGSGANAKMQMCNFCSDHLPEDRKPICVGACPVYALDSGPLDELEAKYGNIKEAEGFVYSPDTLPSVIFKPRKPIPANKK